MVPAGLNSGPDSAGGLDTCRMHRGVSDGRRGRTARWVRRDRGHRPRCRDIAALLMGRFDCCAGRFGNRCGLLGSSGAVDCCGLHRLLPDTAWDVRTRRRTGRRISGLRSLRIRELGRIFDAAAIAGFASAIAAAAAGNAVRNRDRYWKALEERALDAIAARESETNRRVAEERVRIARDLHDMVGHEIAVVNMNLGVAEVNLPPDSQRSRDALDAARAGVTAVLRETQSILQVLRGGSSAVEDQTQPVPGVDQISGLIDSYRRIGLKVNAEIDTVVDKLDPTVDTAIYRIVQEALTNAHRHGNSDVDLAIKSAAGFIVAAVTNRRSSTGSRNLPGEGYGLVGMRERATSAGGVLDIGGDETMFTVTATVPIHGRSIR